MAITLTTKQNGKITETKNISEYDYLSNNDETICWDCTNGFLKKCQKIADLQTKSIDSYSFITDGYQIVKENIITLFVVTKCNNFNKTKIKKE